MLLYSSKNKKGLFVACGIFLFAGIFFLLLSRFFNATENESIAVQTLVEHFGYSIKNVSLLSPTAAQDIEKQYEKFLDPDLLEQWKADPTKAVGRLTSSPWPDKIEIVNIKPLDSNTFIVRGNIIEVTSLEQIQNNIAASQPIEITIAKFNNRWLITHVFVFPYE
jgi:hypothetical protein